MVACTRRIEVPSCGTMTENVYVRCKRWNRSLTVDAGQHAWPVEVSDCMSSDSCELSNE